MTSHDLRCAMDDCVALRTLLTRYVQPLLTQTATTAYANLNFNIEARIARWTLMTQDRWITVLGRDKPMELAGDSYATAEAKYGRLIVHV